MSKNVQVKILEVSGLEIAARYVGLPVGSVGSEQVARPTTRDLAKLNHLVALGDDHAKIMRQVTVHMEITAPRYWWQQFATYRYGVEMYSGSTMHTIHNRRVTPGDFGDRADLGIIDLFNGVLVRGDISDTKANLPEGFLQTRLVTCSYQALRRMWLQHRKHRLPEWHEFIEILHELPYCEALIFVEPHNPWRELWEEVIEVGCWNNDGCCRFCGMHSSENHGADCLFNRADTMMAEEVR